MFAFAVENLRRKWFTGVKHTKNNKKFIGNPAHRWFCEPENVKENAKHSLRIVAVRRQFFME